MAKFFTVKNAPIIFQNALEHLNNHLQTTQYSKIFVLIDENTSIHCLPILKNYLANFSFDLIEITSGEENKTIETVAKVWTFLGENNADRKSLMINLGGGVLTDMGGFIASTFKRGISFINIPTTLLAMVDASAGGKNGIDFNGLKNQIGTFTQPEMVLVEAIFLKTLDQRQIFSGLAEMLKHGLIANEKHWNNLINLPNYNSETLQNNIQDSVSIKLKIVEEDPHEKGLRKILNFGHTIGHAIESEFLTRENFLLHGEAIVIGMLIEAIMSKNFDLITDEQLVEIHKSFKKIYPNMMTIENEDITKILTWLIHDKKNENNQLNFSLLTTIGQANYNQVCTTGAITDAIHQYNNLIKNS